MAGVQEFKAETKRLENFDKEEREKEEGKDQRGIFHAC